MRYSEAHGAFTSFSVIAQTDDRRELDRAERAARLDAVYEAAETATPKIPTVPLQRSRQARAPEASLEAQGYMYAWDVTLGGRPERFELVCDGPSYELVNSGMWLFGGFDMPQPLHLWRSVRQLRFTAQANKTHPTYRGLHRNGVITSFLSGRSRGSIRETVVHEACHALSWGAGREGQMLLHRALALAMDLDCSDLQSGPERDDYATTTLEEQWAQTGMYYVRRQFSKRGANYPYRFALVEAALRGVFG